MKFLVENIVAGINKNLRKHRFGTIFAERERERERERETHRRYINRFYRSTAFFNAYTSSIFPKIVYSHSLVCSNSVVFFINHQTSIINYGNSLCNHRKG